MKKKIIVLIFGVILICLVINLIKNKTYATKELPKVYIKVDNIENFRNMTKEDGEKIAQIEYNDGSKTSFNSYIKIKIQGSTSAKYDKKNYNIKLYKDSECSQKQKIDINQGWGEFNKYTLKANYIDNKTHARNIVTARITAKIQEKYGLFIDTPNNGVIDGFPCEVYINDNSNPLGIYTWNIPKDEKVWNLDKDNSNNIAMEASAGSNSTYFKEEIESIEKLADTYWKIETGSETQETIDKFNKLIKFVKDTSDTEFKEQFEKHINKDAILNYLSVLYMSEATDNVSKNMILVTYDGEIWYPTLYDLDATYGMTPRGQEHEHWNWLPGEGETMNTANIANNSLLLQRVVECFPDEIAERWFELRKEIFTYNNIKKEFSNFYNEIPGEIFLKDFKIWENSYWKSKNYGTIYYKDMGLDLNEIDEFLQERLPYIDDIMYKKYTSEKPASLTVKYSISELTNKDVVATVTANRNDIRFDGMLKEYTFKENGTYTFTAIDKNGSGNIIETIASVNWIDKTVPEAEVSYITTNLTNQNVKVTITANEEIQKVEGWNLSSDKKVLTKEYTENKTETITIKDLAGNETQVEIKITGIIRFKDDTYNIKESYIIGIQPQTAYKKFIENIATKGECKITEGNKDIGTETIIKTGQKLKVGNETYTIVVKGDTNGDGQADIKDILQINKHRLNKAKLENDYLIAGDVNNDEKVDIKDILMINKYRLKKTITL